MMKHIRTLLVSGMVLVLTLSILTTNAIAKTFPKSIFNAEVNVEEPYFTENHEPKLYVYYEDMPLFEGVDYTVTYHYSPQTEKYLCLIKGIGYYCFFKATSFKIEYPGEDIAEYASSSEFLGIPYVWGGTTKNGFDCSGFVQYVYNEYGIDLYRVASDQATQGTKIYDQDELLPGDLVFFNNFGHVGIYIGDDCFVHASSSRGIKISSLHNDSSDGSYYESRYCGATRIL